LRFLPFQSILSPYTLGINELALPWLEMTNTFDHNFKLPGQQIPETNNSIITCTKKEYGKRTIMPIKKIK
jgi:hypothetical protein